MTFTAILEAAQKHDSCTLAIGLAPSLKNLPYSIQSYDDPFLPLGKAIIDATHELVCAYVFDLAAYLSLGASRSGSAGAHNCLCSWPDRQDLARAVRDGRLCTGCLRGGVSMWTQ